MKRRRMQAAVAVGPGRVEELTLIYPQARAWGKAADPSRLETKADDWHYFSGEARPLRNTPIFAVSPSLGLSRGLTSEESRRIKVLSPSQYESIYGPVPDPVRETIQRQSPFTRNMRAVLRVAESYMDDLTDAYPEAETRPEDATDWLYYSAGERNIALSPTLGTSRPMMGDEITLQVFLPAHYMALFGSIPDPLREDVLRMNAEKRRDDDYRNDAGM